MATIDTTRNSLTLVKEFTYRGNDEDWSNTYFFVGDLPSSDASWKTLADNVIAAEKLIYNSGVSVVTAIGHQAGESVAVWSYDYAAADESVPGTFDSSSARVESGDTAAWIRYSTDQKSDKGKPIYLRNYYHPAYSESSGSADTLEASWRDAAATFGAAWITGFEDGDSETHVRCGPKGAVGLVPVVASFATTRTLKRRGRRP